MDKQERFLRGAGILLPIFSLPSKYGIGAMDEASYRFVDFLKEAGQKYWQILPNYLHLLNNFDTSWNLIDFFLF